MIGSSIPIGPLRDVLKEHGLDHATEEPFPNDGWSGAALTRLRGGDADRYVLKRDSVARDWIARATNDGPMLREAWLAAHAPSLNQMFSGRVRASYLGVGRAGDEFGILMPDLSGVLFDWGERISVSELDRVVGGIAALHVGFWDIGRGFSRVFDTDDPDRGPWCPLLERITLISRAALERPGPARDAVATRLLPGWDAFDRHGSAAARAVIATLGDRPEPLIDALGRQPRALIHGDLKLANVGIAADGVTIETVDWQMVSFAPVAVELGWFLVANVACLPLPPDDVLARYRSCLASMSDAHEDQRILGDWEFDQDGYDAAILVGLLLRGWRKGLDVEAGITLASGLSAADDLAWWCERAVEAADRIL